MKTFSTAWQAELDAGRGITSGAVKVESTPAFRVWGGYGDLTIAGETYIGIGQNGLIEATGSQLGGQEQAVELTLSGVDPDILALVDASAVRKARVTIWRLGFDASATVLLDARVFARGVVDNLKRECTPGGAATLKCVVETAARGLGRVTGRLRSDADQRMVNSADGGFSRVTQAGELTLAWGGKPPARTSNALPGTLVAGGGGGLVNGFDVHIV